ncbi:hypothetical protein C8J57DRAFT_228401 [Mycena rebaudengoi]|nr:hypothetical protein C8J57DRAFT_228401 [Mycena rebaudengoi]
MRAPSTISCGVQRVWCRVRIHACEDHALRPACTDFGASSQNFIPFTPQGRLIALAGFNNLACKTNIFDRCTFSNVCTIDAPNTSYCDWWPDRRFLLTATLHDCASTAEARYGTSPACSCTSSPSRRSTRRRGGPRPSTRSRRSCRCFPRRSHRARACRHSSPCRSPRTGRQARSGQTSTASCRIRTPFTHEGRITRHTPQLHAFAVCTHTWEIRSRTRHRPTATPCRRHSTIKIPGLASRTAPRPPKQRSPDGTRRPHQSTPGRAPAAWLRLYPRGRCSAPAPAPAPAHRLAAFLSLKSTPQRSSRGNGGRQQDAHGASRDLQDVHIHIPKPAPTSPPDVSAAHTLRYRQAPASDTDVQDEQGAHAVTAHVRSPCPRPRPRVCTPQARSSNTGGQQKTRAVAVRISAHGGVRTDVSSRSRAQAAPVTQHP